MEPATPSMTIPLDGAPDATRVRGAGGFPGAVDPRVEIARNVEAAAASVRALVPEPAAGASSGARARSEVLNRVINVTIAILALIFLLPVMLLIAVAIKVSSPGPVFYSQSRVGLDRRQRDRRGRRSGGHGAPGRHGAGGADGTEGAVVERRNGDRRTTNYGGSVFTIYKFRTMVVDAERAGAQWATKDDPRVTPIGRFLRRTRLDEIPQLWNVVKGDMNIVGPRPERPAIVLELCRHIPHYPLRHRARPGITGWAQINHTYDNCIDDVRTKVRYDLEYLQRQGLLEDLKIMVRTVPVMLFRRGSQ